MADETYSYTGSVQTLTVPDTTSGGDTVGGMIVDMYGAEGGIGYARNEAGGNGGYLRAEIRDGVEPGAQFDVYVGGQGGEGSNGSGGSGGFNGGGAGGDSYSGAGGGGGGASDIRPTGGAISDRLAVAAGGGGGGDATSDSGYDSYRGSSAGADGGGLQGNDASNASANSASATGGSGGTQTSGGSGGNSAGSGSSGTGGAGDGAGSLSPDNASAGGGGGGGGLYGGGGGGADTYEGSSSTWAAGAGGGGGSSGVASNVEQLNTTIGSQTGDGVVEVTYVAVNPPNAPSNLTVDATRDTEADLSWTLATDGADENQVNIYRDTSSGIDPSTDTPVDTLPAGTETYTDTGLNNGTTYYYVVTAENDGGESNASNEASGTTTVPDVTGFTLDGTVQGEMLAEDFDSGLNTGQYRIQWKRSTNSSYSDEATVAYNADPLEYNITGVLDGEQYDVRIRSEGPDAVGTYHTASEITKLHAPDGVTKCDEYALEFDESGEEVTASNDPLATAWNSSRQLTIAVDIRIDAINTTTTYANVADYATSADGSARLERANDNNYIRWTFPKSDGNTNYAPAIFSSMEVGEWHTLTLVVDYPNESQSFGYVDGDLDSTKDDPGTSTDWNTAESFRYFFEGWANYTLGRVAAWDRPLSAKEVEAQANGALPRDGLIAAHVFNEGSGTTSDDLSSNSNDATISGSPTWVAGDSDLKHFSLRVGWNDNSNFDGSYQIWRDRLDGKRDSVYDDPDLGELIATVSDTTAEYYDGESPAIDPDKDYTYTIRAQTQYVYADGVGTLTPDSAGLAQYPAGPRGWHVEIDLPSGRVVRPQILDDVRIEPRVNDLPRVRVPVPRDEAYTLQDYEGAAMRVFRDGERQPIDELEDVVIEPGKSELVGLGGTQLERRVQRDVIQEAAHTLADDLVTTETDYATVVDTPDVDSVTGELLRSVDTESEFVDELSPASTEPWVTDSGGIRPAQTCYYEFAQREDFGNYSGIGSADTMEGYIDDAVRTFTSNGDYIEFYSFSPEYTIPADSVGFAIRWGGDSSPNDMAVIVKDASDDTEVGRIEYQSGSQSFGPYVDFDDTSFGTTWNGSDLKAGTDYYIRLECTQSNSETYVGAIMLHDKRYYDQSRAGPDFYSSVDTTSDQANAPALYPPRGTSITSADAETIYSIDVGYVTSTWSETSGPQAIALSNDNGLTWTESSNTTSLTADFADLSSTVRIRLTAGAYSPDGTRDTDTPRDGYDAQRIDDYEITFDGDDTPLILNDSWDEDLLDILVDIAERSDSLFEVRQAGETTEVHWAQAGQRASTQDLDLASYSVTKRGEQTLRATIKGGGRTTRETIDAGHDTAVALEQSTLVPGTETVRDASTGENYQYLRDYTISNSTGELTVQSGGEIADGQTLEVEYDYKVTGTFEADSYAGDPRTDRTKTINGLTTERGCELAAKLIVDTASTPRWEADVEIPAAEYVNGLLEAIDVDGIAGEAMSVYDLEITPERLSLRLGSRKRAEDSIEQIRSTVDATSDRV
ncbi:fibronectin type III domain-containing protein [Halosolutus halophilus]|uniref:fibronectin type III domain-containing protein n=1 Tax=Halosolutus halophilus TaxID=1552990 RepID=UPI002A59B06B|nr:fibronectin type III domain-containing protein [Halosolutus halophilus]